MTFGLSIIIQNVLLEVFSADSRRLDAGALETASLGARRQARDRLVPAASRSRCAVLSSAGLQLLPRPDRDRPRLPRHVRRPRDRRADGHRQPARLRAGHGASSLAIVAVAGVFLGIRTTFTVRQRPRRLLFAFEAVIIGGLGSLWGTLVGRRRSSASRRPSGARLDAGLGHPRRAPRLPRRAARSGPQGLFARTARHDVTALMPSHAVARRATPRQPRRGRRRVVLVVLVSAARLGRRRPHAASLVEFITLLVLAQMWNLLAGYGGLVSIGQQAFVGLGGYALIVLADDLGVEPVPRRAAGGAGRGARSRCRPRPLVFRLRGGYFAIGTWVIAEVVPAARRQHAPRSAAARAAR